MSGRYHFVPVAVETSGVWGKEGLTFVRQIGQRISSLSGELKSTCFLLQRVSIAIQRGNVASVLGTLPPGRELLEIFYLWSDLFTYTVDNYLYIYDFGIWIIYILFWVLFTYDFDYWYYLQFTHNFEFYLRMILNTIYILYWILFTYDYEYYLHISLDMILVIICIWFLFVCMWCMFNSSNSVQ